MKEFEGYEGIELKEGRNQYEGIFHIDFHRFFTCILNYTLYFVLLGYKG